MKFTPEMRAKAVEARKANIAAAMQKYRMDWLDSSVWNELAKTHGIRLPSWMVAPTPRKLKQWHERLDKEDFKAVYGCSPAKLISLNPRIPLRVFVGQMLERL